MFRSRGPLNIWLIYFDTTGNANYGYWGGGSVGGVGDVSLIDRVDYSNDTPTGQCFRGPLSAKETYSSTAQVILLMVTGVVDLVHQSLTSDVSTIERLDFSNDTSTNASSRGPLNRIAGILDPQETLMVTGLVVLPPLPQSDVLNRVDFAE